MACFRLHDALLESKVESHLLTLDNPPRTVVNHSNYYNFYEKLYAKRSWLEKVVQKIGYTSGSSHEVFVKDHRKIQRSILLNKIEGLEVFTFPISNYDITLHPLYKQADLIHFHWVSDGFVDFKIFFSKNNKPLVWTLHDMNPFTGGCHFSGECNGFNESCNYCPDLKGTTFENYAGKMLEYKRKGLKKAKVEVVSPSRWLMLQSASSALFKNFNHNLIPYSIDTKIYKYRDKFSAKKSLGLDPSKRYFLFSAYNVKNKRKGIEYLIDVLRGLSHLSKEFELLIIGKNEGLSALDSFNTHFRGFIARDDEMANYYQASDLFIMPSVADNFPNVVIESVTCGTPVMAFEIGGIPDIITNGLNGILVKDISVNALMEALERFIIDKPVFNYDSISREATGRYNYTVIANEYTELYIKLLRGH
jgi:glycosyltransferase involved in cell wall biosynthesis